MTETRGETAIRVQDVVVGFGDRIILNHLTLDVRKGEILGFVGGSGSGKSVLLRTIIGLLPKRAGTIEVLGVNLETAAPEALHAIQRRWGVLFQHGALFSSLTVRQNVQFAMREYLQLPEHLMDDSRACEACNGRTFHARRRKIPVRIIGWNDKARCACTCTRP